MRRYCNLVLCTLVVLCTIAVSIPQLYGQSKALPISERKVTLKVTFPDGEWAIGTVSEGSLLRIERDGAIFGFAPAIHDESTGLVALKVFKIKRNKKGLESIKEIENLDAYSNSTSVTTKSAPSFDVHVEGIETKVATQSVVKPQNAPGGGGQCCVTCGSTTACANCGVTMSCGSCCLDPCCPH